MTQANFIPTQPPRKRTNKALTERIVTATLSYIFADNPAPTTTAFRDNLITVDTFSTLTVSLLGEPILQITRTASNVINKVIVFYGDINNDSGNPSSTAREQLNGLLSALGDYGIIPLKVRVFMDWECGLCYLGSGDQKIALTKSYANMVSIDANTDKFTFEDLTNYKR